MAVVTVTVAVEQQKYNVRTTLDKYVCMYVITYMCVCGLVTPPKTQLRERAAATSYIFKW